jgi:hypothetical protein
MHAVADGRARIGEVTDEHPEYPLVCPGVERELTKRAPRDAAGGAVVGPVERRAGHRIDERKGRDARDDKAAGDLGIRIGVGVVLDQQIDVRGDRCLGVGEGTRGVAGIVEIYHVDWQTTRRQFEAASQLGSREAEPVQRHTWRLIEIGERDTKTLRLGPCGTETACKQSGQQWPAPQHRPRRSLLNRLDVDEGAGQADRLGHRHRQEERGPVLALTTGRPAGLGHENPSDSRHLFEFGQA